MANKSSVRGAGKEQREVGKSQNRWQVQNRWKMRGRKTDEKRSWDGGVGYKRI